MKLDIYNIEGKKTSKKITLDKDVFGAEKNEHCLYLVVKSELAAKRQGTSKSKSKSEVRGTGAKPWKQKGTGRARAGRLRNPSRVHGGTAFGPEPRNYNVKINKKVRKIARLSALSEKCSAGNIIVMDKLILSDIKTKSIESVLNHLKINNQKVSFLSSVKDSNFYLSCRNLKGVNTFKVEDVSVYELMNSNTLIMDLDSVEYLNSLGKN
jgi:large subunit ribosomal protein L4